MGPAAMSSRKPSPSIRRTSPNGAESNSSNRPVNRSRHAELPPSESSLYRLSTVAIPKGTGLPLNSMTGFADSRGSHGGLRWRWEAKSVNGRGLDFRFRAPMGYEGLEVGARTLAAERLRRGSLQVVLTVAADEGTRGFRVDAAALADAVRIAKRVAEETGLAPARVDGLLALKGVVVQEENAALNDEARMARDAALLESLANAFDLLVGAREAEGTKLEAVLLKEIADIERLTAEAGALAAQQPFLLRERMMAQLKELLAPGSNLSEDRIAQEIAMLAAKAD